MKHSVIIFFLIIFAISGCAGKDAVKESEESSLTREAMAVIRSVERAYQDRNKVMLEQRLAPEVLKDALLAISYEKTDLQLTPWIVKIKGDLTIVNVDWEGTWVNDGNELKRRGIADIVLRGSPLKVVRIDGDNPFGINKKEDDHARTDDSAIKEESPGHDRLAVQQPRDRIDKDELKIKRIHRIEDHERPDVEGSNAVYYVQIGAWSHPEHANNALKELQKYYPEAEIIVEDNLHKVRVQNIQGKAYAEEILMDIQQKLHIDAFMKRVN